MTRPLPIISARKLHNMLDRDCEVIDGPSYITEIVTLKNGRGQIMRFHVKGFNRWVERQQTREI